MGYLNIANSNQSYTSCYYTKSKAKLLSPEPEICTLFYAHIAVFTNAL